jgi:hypothetical protein
MPLMMQESATNMKTYMVTYENTGFKKYTRFEEFDSAVNFAEHMSKRHSSEVQVRNYDTDELVYTVDPKIDLDKKPRF